MMMSTWFVKKKQKKTHHPLIIQVYRKSRGKVIYNDIWNDSTRWKDAKWKQLPGLNYLTTLKMKRKKKRIRRRKSRELKYKAKTILDHWFCRYETGKRPTSVRNQDTTKAQVQIRGWLREDERSRCTQRGTAPCWKLSLCRLELAAGLSVTCCCAPWPIPGWSPAGGAETLATSWGSSAGYIYSPLHVLLLLWA